MPIAVVYTTLCGCTFATGNGMTPSSIAACDIQNDTTSELYLAMNNGALPNLMYTHQLLALSKRILPQGHWKQTAEGGWDDISNPTQLLV